MNKRQQQMAAAKAISTQIAIDLAELRLRLLLIKDLKKLVKKSKEILAMTAKQVILHFQEVLFTNRESFFKQAMLLAPTTRIEMSDETTMAVYLKMQKAPLSEFGIFRGPVPPAVLFTVLFRDKALETREVATLNSAEREIKKTLTILESLTMENVAELLLAYETARMSFNRVALTPGLRRILATPDFLYEERGIANQFSNSILRGPLGVGVPAYLNQSTF